MTSQPRPFTKFAVTPPEAPTGVTHRYNEAASPHLIWLLLKNMMDVPESGRALFPRPLANQNRLWREFANYIRQAKAYWDAANATGGSSAALLYYYAILNLAKGELLTTIPTAILGNQRIHHGLTFRPTRSLSIAGDALKVGDGVFKLLYEKRTGRQLATNTLLNVTRLFRLIPEIGLELEQSGFGDSRSTWGYHAVVSDDTGAWPLLCFVNRAFLSDEREPVRRLMLRHYDEIDRNQMGTSWRKVFALSTRLYPSWVAVYQAKETFAQPLPGGESTFDLDAAARHLRRSLSPYVSEPVTLPAEFVLSPSLLKSRELPMPPPLARYAAMFYVSSLVRYRPAALDPVQQARQAWMIESFTNESPIHLLAASHAGIRGTSQSFEAAGYRI